MVANHRQSGQRFYFAARRHGAVITSYSIHYTKLYDADDYSNIRLQLKRAGLSTPEAGSNNGDSLLLKDPGFGVSQRLEGERLKFSREQQLARAIEQYNNVSKAMVLLAIPKDNVFARNERKPSATVVLTLGGGSLKQEEVDAIV